MNQELKIGMKFGSTNFPMIAEIANVKETENKLEVFLIATNGHMWFENDWNLQHTIWGFERGEYFVIQQTPSL
jgi:hypothetical protein